MAKVALVTGTNRGLGYAITKRLCKEFQGTVIMTARDEKKGNEVCEQLHQDGCKTVFHQLDITSQESINKLRNFLEEKYGALDILINNSGIMFKGASTLPYHEQAEQSVNTNFFGTLNMCKTFFPLLQPHARVVNVSSVYGVTSIVGEDLQRKFASPKLTVEGVVALMEQYVGDAKAGHAGENGWPVPGQIVVPAYAVSKLGVTALSAAQARKMKNDPREDIIVNSVCPGWCRTDMGGQNAPRRAERGAKTPVYCALLPPGTTSPNGDFVKDEKIYPWMQIRLKNLHGLDERRNDVVFCGSEGQQHVIFFPGDIQDYVENMAEHKDHQAWKQWNLESTARILERRFPNSFIWVVRPSRYHQHTFACYNNFVETNLLGAPDHRNTDFGGLKHLQRLLESAVRRVLDLDPDEEDVTFDFPIVLVGFSKGCVVLNQLIHELSTAATGVDSKLYDFMSRITTIYWLDGGHSGESNTWITDEKYLYYLAKHIANIRVHVTPYQMNDSTRPWIRIEQELFVDKLRSLGAAVKTKTHFQDRDPSLYDHFRLLESF